MTEVGQPARLVVVSGNVQRPSKSRGLAELIAARIAAHAAVDIRSYDILDAGPGLGAAFTRPQLSPEALAVVTAIEDADVLVVGTPVYKGSYTGLFKHLFDFVDMQALAGKPVVISATGGGQRHALVVEHQLRPLFGFFTAQTIATAVYAEDRSFENYRQVDPAILGRIEQAALEAAMSLEWRQSAASRRNGIGSAAGSSDETALATLHAAASR